MKLLIMQPSPASLHLLPLRSKYSPHLPVLNTLSPYTSLSERDQVSHPHKTTGKIIHFLKFLERREGDNF
jgi:hypothetical protein